MTIVSIIKNATFFLPLLFSSVAYAIGDSAGGCGGGGSPLEVAAISGTPSELETEIDRRVAYATDWAKKNQNLLSHPIWNKFSIWIAPETISQPIPNKRTIFINWWSGCNEDSLLELAAAGGNQIVAQYLLDNDANPNIANPNGDTIFMRCANLASDRKTLSVNGVPYPTRTKLEADGKIAVYSQLLARGGDLNRANAGGLSALHLCKDPEAIAFYLKNGANPNLPVEKDRRKRQNTIGLMSIPVLDFRLQRIVEDYDWERDANFSIFQQLLPMIKNKTLEKETQWRICYKCSNPRRAETCNRLSKMIDVPNKDIFRSKEQGEKEEVAIEQCRIYIP